MAAESSHDLSIDAVDDPGWAPALQDWRAIALGFFSPAKAATGGPVLLKLRSIVLAHLLMVALATPTIWWFGVRPFRAAADLALPRMIVVAFGIVAIAAILAWRPTLPAAPEQIRPVYLRITLMRLAVANAAVASGWALAMSLGDTAALLYGLSTWVVAFGLAAPSALRLRLDQNRCSTNLLGALLESM